MDQAIEKLHSLSLAEGSGGFFGNQQAMLLKKDYERMAMEQERRIYHATKENEQLRHILAAKEEENNLLRKAINILEKRASDASQEAEEAKVLRQKVKQLEQANFALTVHLQTLQGSNSESSLRMRPPDVF